MKNGRDPERTKARILEAATAELERLAPIVSRAAKITVILDGPVRAAAAGRLDAKREAAAAFVRRADRQQRHHVHQRTLARFVVLPQSVLQELRDELATDAVDLAARFSTFWDVITTDTGNGDAGS